MADFDPDDDLDWSQIVEAVQVRAALPRGIRSTPTTPRSAPMSS